MNRTGARTAAPVLLALCALALAPRGLALPGAALPDGWHTGLEDGTKAAKASAKPVLVVTLWPDEKCDACKQWRTGVRKDEGVAKAAARFERVEWPYDGLKGRVVTWTKANGGTSDDPSAQVFVLDHDGRVRGRCPDGEAYQPAALVAWLAKQAASFDKDLPRSRVPFARGETAVAGEGKLKTAACEALDQAVAGSRPVLLYFSRDGAEAKDRRGQGESAASRSFEKGCLSSEPAVAAAAGWTLLRFDVGEEGGRILARRYGVEAAPALVLVAPGAEKPAVLDGSTSGSALAARLRKSLPAVK